MDEQTLLAVREHLRSLPESEIERLVSPEDVTGKASTLAPDAGLSSAPDPSVAASFASLSGLPASITAMSEQLEQLANAAGTARSPESTTHVQTTADVQADPFLQRMAALRRLLDSFPSPRERQANEGAEQQNPIGNELVTQSQVDAVVAAEKRNPLERLFGSQDAAPADLDPKEAFVKKHGLSFKSQLETYPDRDDLISGGEVSLQTGEGKSVGHARFSRDGMAAHHVAEFPGTDRQALKQGVFRMDGIEVDQKIQGQGLGSELYLRSLNAFGDRPYFYNSQLSSQAMGSLEKMSERGLVEFHQHPRDPERHAKRITEKGQEYLQQIDARRAGLSSSPLSIDKPLPPGGAILAPPTASGTASPVVASGASPLADSAAELPMLPTDIASVATGGASGIPDYPPAQDVAAMPSPDSPLSQADATFIANNSQTIEQSATATSPLAAMPEPASKVTGAMPEPAGATQPTQLAPDWYVPPAPPERSWTEPQSVQAHLAAIQDRPAVQAPTQPTQFAPSGWNPPQTAARQTQFAPPGAMPHADRGPNPDFVSPFSHEPLAADAFAMPEPFMPAASGEADLPAMTAPSFAAGSPGEEFSALPGESADVFSAGGGAGLDLSRVEGLLERLVSAMEGGAGGVAVQPDGSGPKQRRRTGGMTPIDIEADEGFPAASPAVNVTTLSGAGGAGGRGSMGSRIPTPQSMVSGGQGRPRPGSQRSSFTEPNR